MGLDKLISDLDFLINRRVEMYRSPYHYSRFNYDVMKKLVKNTICTQEDIQSLINGGFKNYDLTPELYYFYDDNFIIGSYISILAQKLIKHSYDKVELDLTKIELKGIGFKLKKGYFLVKGDVTGAGRNMSGGHLHIKGDAGNVGQCMSGGNIVVQGDAEMAGDRMSGGNIVVQGHLRSAGYNMKGGILIANSIDNIEKNCEGIVISDNNCKIPLTNENIYILKERLTSQFK